MCDIGELHNKFSQSSYDDFLSTTINKWKGNIELKCFVCVRKYMRVQAKTIIRKKQLIPTEYENEYLYKHYNPKLG